MSEYKNSNGYFKDPVTLADLSPATPRVIACSIDETGKFIWPQVKVSNGDIVKIVYKLFTQEEKDLYKQYRSKDGQRAPRAIKPKPAPVQQVAISEEDAADVALHDVLYKECSAESVASGKMLAYIKICNENLGVWIFENITHYLLSVKGSNQYMPVPLSLIPMEDRERLGIPTRG